MSCLPCPSLHSFLSSPVFFRFYHYVQCCYLYFLAALYFLDFPVYPLLSVLTLLSCPITLVCISCLYLLSNPPSPAITVLSCSASYSILLSCPVPWCLSCLLLSILSLTARPVSCPVCHPWSILSKELYLNIQYKIQSWLSFSSFHVPLIIFSRSVLAERPVQEVLSCYPVLGILS